MPTIRDGRGIRTVHDMAATPGSPSGPVERLTGYGPATEQPAVTARRSTAAALAISRARGASRGGFVKGATKPEVRDRQPELVAESRSRGGLAKARNRNEVASQERRVATMNASLSPRQGEVVEALGRLGSRRAVMTELGMGVIQEVDVALIRVHEKGLLPAGLPDLPPRLQRAIGARHSESTTAATQAPRVNSTGVERAPLKHPVQVDPAGLTSAEHRRAAAAVDAGITPPNRSGNISHADSTPAAAEPDPPSGGVRAGLPCASCAHAAVCSIRPVVEAWREAIARPEAPHAAITVVEARLEVVCEHFLAAAS